MHCCVYWQRYGNLCALICTFAMITCLNVYKIITLYISLRTKAILPTWNDVIYTKKDKIAKNIKAIYRFWHEINPEKNRRICFEFVFSLMKRPALIKCVICQKKPLLSEKLGLLTRTCILLNTRRQYLMWLCFYYVFRLWISEMVDNFVIFLFFFHSKKLT